MRNLAMLRGIAILAVVANHATAWAIMARIYWASRIGSPITPPDRSWIGTPSYYGLLVVSELTLFSVPLFMLATGWFTAYAHRGGQGQLRVRTVLGWLVNLFWPCVTWAFVAMWLSLGWHTASELLRPTTEAWSPGVALGDQLRSYWFIYVMAIYFVVSPLLIGAVRSRGPQLLLALALPYAFTFDWDEWRVRGLYVPGLDEVANALGALRRLGTPGTVVEETLHFALLYALGIWSFTGSTVLVRFAKRWGRTLRVAAGALLALAVVEADFVYRQREAIVGLGWNPASRNLPILGYGIAMVLLLLAVDWKRGRAVRFIEYVGTRSLPLFIAHFLFIIYTAKVVYHLAPELVGAPLALAAVLFIAGIAGPLLALEAVGRSPARGFTRFAFGVGVPARRRGGGPPRAGARQPAPPADRATDQPLTEGPAAAVTAASLLHSMSAVRRE